MISWHLVWICSFLITDKVYWPFIFLLLISSLYLLLGTLLGTMSCSYWEVKFLYIVWVPFLCLVYVSPQQMLWDANPIPCFRAEARIPPDAGSIGFWQCPTESLQSLPLPKRAASPRSRPLSGSCPHPVICQCGRIKTNLLSPFQDNSVPVLSVGSASSKALLWAHHSSTPPLPNPTSIIPP